MRNRKSWDQVGKTIKKVSSTKLISNEKVRQKKTLQPDGEGFSAVKGLKTYTDQKDIFLIYDINENEQYVFKTSLRKMKIARRMDEGYSHFLFFMMNIVTLTAITKRVKSFVTTDC